LPPPITRHNSTPRACTVWISSAMRASISGSRPYSRAPISASPETFKRTRRYLRSADMRPALIRPDDLVARSNRGYTNQSFPSIFRRHASRRQAEDRQRAPVLTSSSALELSGYLGGEVGSMAINSFAEGEAGETSNLNGRAGRLPRLFHHRRYSGPLIDHKDLLEQDDILVELAQPAVHHPFGDVLGLAARLRLLAQYAALAVERRLRHRSDVEIERARRCDMHRQLLAERCQPFVGSGGRQDDNDADLADARAERIMDVRKHRALPGRQSHYPAKDQILSDRRDQMGQLGFDRAVRARKRGLSQRLDCAVAVEREPADAPYEALERLVARHEIGLGVDLDDGTDGTARRDPDEPFCSDPPRLVGGRCQPLLPQPVDGCLDIAAAVAERPLAIHHPGARLFTQLSDQRGGHFRHLRTLPSNCRRPTPLLPRSAARCGGCLRLRLRRGPLAGGPRGGPPWGFLHARRYRPPTRRAPPAGRRAPRLTPDRNR